VFVYSGTGLAGYTGFYGRQLALLKEKELASSRAASHSSTAAAAASASAVAQSASARSVSVAAKTSSLKKQTTSVETKQTSVRSEQSREVEQRRVQFLSQQQQSVKEGRQSMSRFDPLHSWLFFTCLNEPALDNSLAILVVNYIKLNYI
jgi:hypothetical protein